MLAVEPHNLRVELFGLAFEHRLFRLVGEREFESIAIDDKDREALLHKNIPCHPMGFLLAFGRNVPLGASLDSFAVLRQHLMNETLRAEGSIVENRALVVLPAVILGSSSIFDRHDVHVLEFVEQRLGRCREAEHVDVVVCIDEREELVGDKLVAIIGLIQPNLKNELFLKHRAPIEVLNNRRDVGNPLSVGTADDVADLTGSRDGPPDGSLIALGDTIIPRRELDITFAVDDDFLEVILDTLRCLLGKQEVVCAKDEVDDFLAVARLGEILDNLPNHDEGLARLFRFANKHEPFP